MLDLLREALQSSAGSFGFIFCILMVVFIGIWKVSHFSTKFRSVERLENNIEAIREDIHGIKAFIQIFRETNNPFAKRQSPVSLTEAGKKTFEEIKAEDMIKNHWDKFNSAVKKSLDDNCNPYDIQVASFKVGDKYQEFLSSEEIDRIKTHAFKGGYNLDLYNLLFGIIIRDMFLKQKGYNSEDVDKYDPSKLNQQG